MKPQQPNSKRMKRAEYVIEYWCREYKIIIAEYLLQLMIQYVVIIIGLTKSSKYVNRTGPDRDAFNIATIFDAEYPVSDDATDDGHYQYAYSNPFIDFQDSSILTYQLIFKILDNSFFSQPYTDEAEFMIGICRDNKKFNKNQEMSSYLSHKGLHLQLGIFKIHFM